MIDNPNLQSESPQVFAKRIGIQKKSRSGTSSTATLSWDECVARTMTGGSASTSPSSATNSCGPPLLPSSISKSKMAYTPDGRTLYVALCEVCFQVTRPQPRISAVIRRQHHHGQKHVGEMLRRACPQPAARETVVKPRTRIVRAIVAAPTRRDAA